jgi:hypothetical protein
LPQRAGPEAGAFLELGIAKLRWIGADHALADDRVLDEALSLKPRLAPAMRPGGMATRAVFREQRLPGGGLGAIDAAQDVLRPLRQG